MRKLILTVVLLLTFSCSAYCKDIQYNDDYMDFSVNGKVVHAIIPNKDTRSDFILLKKALKGDADSREFLLGGHDYKWFFVGDAVGPAKWIKLTANSQQLVEY